jgi:hypothetical protein
MIKNIKDYWTGEDIDLDKSFYLVNTDLVSCNNLKKEEIIIYYDTDGNKYDEEDVEEFNNVEDLVIFLEDKIISYEYLIEDLINNKCVKTARRYKDIKKGYEDILKRLNKLKIEGSVE